jgi:hypothetical protein
VVSGIEYNFSFRSHPLGQAATNCALFVGSVPRVVKSARRWLGSARFARNEALVVKNNVEKRAVDLQIVTAVVVNEPHLPEPVHEEANPRASRAYHLC